MSDQRNLIVAILLSVGIILGFQFFYELPRMREAQEMQQAQQERTEQEAATAERPVGQATPPSPDGTPQAGAGTVATPAPAGPANREQIVASGDRLRIDNGRLHGSLSLQGGRIDDITLADYFTTVERTDEIELLSPPGAAHPYFVEFGWVPDSGGVRVPDAGTVWQVVDQGERVDSSSPVTLRWDNGEGVVFERTVGLDDNYMFTVTQRVINNGDRPVTVFPYGLISRWETPQTSGFWILHEGPIGVFQGTLHEPNYADLVEAAQTHESDGGWMGITDKYWLTALVPDQDSSFKSVFQHTSPAGGGDHYQIDYLREGSTIQPGASSEVTDRLFVGAKEVNLLDSYGEELGIPLFDRAVDFGWFYFLTKPMFHLLTWLHHLVGNYGVAILLVTLLVKLAFYPLANKSYRAMSKMKQLQPEMQKLRERHADDKMKMNQELMALYKRDKVNPMSGCLPIVVQIPVFFALYKVLFVSIEMRHAPFFGWIHDLSAPDPTTLFNLFGLLPFTPPAMLMLGVWPILMGITMFLQTKLNPQPPDPMQARIMLMLPLVFVFLFATFPAGLVIYWTWNNILSIAQQRTIMWRMGVKP
ncbi:membrane protein insertase YidC [Marinivivus vitaminiproducens]|uniref:membrane protein insertase YidC n=1 Tax=Marinivivus vitaminiproducens TaxID=3035935 RepID=UPI00279DAA6D|nr:membrane protein insertase YidC [Geminicoccaceae bacterium SCSIO 64248]